MRYRLVHLTGSLAGRIREVDSTEVVLGRDPAVAEVVFGPSDRHVSRRHASIAVEDGVLKLRDLESSTGTFLGGENIAEADLDDGDVIELGQGGPQVRIEWSAGGTLLMPIPNLKTAPPQEPDREPPPRPLPGSRLRLTFLSGTRKDSFVEQAGAVVRIGRAKGNTVWTPEDRVVSDQHAKIVRLEDAYVLMDLESTNGTFLNGQRIERASLRDGDAIGLGAGGPELRIQILTPDLAERLSQATVVVPNFAELARRAGETFFLSEVPIDREQLTLGRGPEADLRLESPIVSRAHARVRRDDGGMTLQDLGSTNGTFLGSNRIEEAALRDGDRFVVGPFIVEVAGRALRLLDTRNRARLDARGLSVSAGGKPILDAVSLSLPPGSFTALIGASGAGKSTLLRALSGARPADTGEVFLNGADLYGGFEALKATLGYVPQDDIVHQELTVAQSLDYTARLRLPSDTRREERQKRIAAVLATLELSERHATPIHRLSGGQRKRVSIATELLTEPNLIFLDEPTSGLDPGLEEQLMVLLRELAHKGKTVVLVTHTLDNIHLCDGVVLLVDGRLAFYGSPEETRERFGIDHMVNLYARLKERTATSWQEEFRASADHRRLVDEPLQSVPSPPVRVTTAPPAATGMRQLRILAARYLAALNRDSRNALLLVGQAPLIAGLIGLSLLYGQSDIAFTKPKNTILFLLSLVAVWFGCSNAAREIVKEKAIYLRERMVNVRIFPYVLSKLVVLAGLAAVQCVIFLLILHAWFGIPGRPEQLLAAMLLASSVGILLGLALSALVSTADRAMTLLPIALIPQVLFTFPAVQMDMKGPAGYVARAMPTWWAYDLVRRVALAPDATLDDDALEKKLQEGGPVLMTRARFERLLRDGYMMFNYRSAIEMTWTASWPEALGERLPPALGPWRPAIVDAAAMVAFAMALLGAAAALQKRKDRRE